MKRKREVLGCLTWTMLLIIVACTAEPTPNTALSTTFPAAAEQIESTREQESTADIRPAVTRVSTITPSPTEVAELLTEATPTLSPTLVSASPPLSPLTDLYGHISSEKMLAALEELVAIEAYSGWRNSATVGEAQGLDMVSGWLNELTSLGELGLELERQEYHVFNATELWETQLHLTIGGQEIEVPADGLRGFRHNVSMALSMDSDGEVNDTQPNPQAVTASVTVIRDYFELAALTSSDLADKIVMLDYAAIDRVTMDNATRNQIATELLDKSPAGIVLITSYSNELDVSHGSFVGDSSVFYWLSGDEFPPILYTRLEDLAVAGIEDWDDLTKIESASMVWDADVLAPGTGGNLVATIPGEDRSRAIILGAHIDSPNSPGALDDGSGSIVLWEVARVLDEAQFQPAVDLVLVWFGSEEIGTDGSSYFVATHQDLLDRTLGVLTIDCLGRPLEGVNAQLVLGSYPAGRSGDSRILWADYLSQLGEELNVSVYANSHYNLESDNSGFIGFGVPNANLIYKDLSLDRKATPIHYYLHLHDPYDTVDLAREVDTIFEQMAIIALAAAVETGRNPDTVLNVAPTPNRRAVFVGSHTEPALMSPAAFYDFGLLLAMNGFDVDMIPYGQVVTTADLENTDMVIALPVIDYPSDDGDLGLYDEAWSDEELEVLEDYVASGGLLVLTNSFHRLSVLNRVMDYNEDWKKVNQLAERFGILYRPGLVRNYADIVQGHPLMEGIYLSLAILADNAIPVLSEEGTILAQFEDDAAAVIVGYGPAGGEVLALADLGMLGSSTGAPRNLHFWENLALYAKNR